MKRWQKITIILSLILLAASLINIPLPTKGATIINRLVNVGVNAGYSNITTDSFPQAFGRIINVFLSILGVIFMAYMVYGGYLWMIARGNEEQVNRAKAVIRGSIIGIIIVLAAYAISAFVVNRFSQAGGYQGVEQITDTN